MRRPNEGLPIGTIETHVQRALARGEAAFQRVGAGIDLCFGRRICT